MRAGCVIIGRMASDRFPGKMLAELYGKPMVVWEIEHAVTAGCDPVILATSEEREDDPLAETAERAGATVYRGSAMNLLDRKRGAYDLAGREWCFEVSGDSPFNDLKIWRRMMGMMPVASREKATVISAIVPLSTGTLGASPGTAFSGRDLQWYESYYRRRPEALALWQEQYWACDTEKSFARHEKRHKREFKVAVDDLLPRQKTPMKCSIDYPIELDLWNRVIKYIGHWPSGFAEITDAYTTMRGLG